MKEQISIELAKKLHYEYYKNKHPKIFNENKNEFIKSKELFIEVNLEKGYIKKSQKEILKEEIKKINENISYYSNNPEKYLGEYLQIINLQTELIKLQDIEIKEKLNEL